MVEPIFLFHRSFYGNTNHTFHPKRGMEKVSAKFPHAKEVGISLMFLSCEAPTQLFERNAHLFCVWEFRTHFFHPPFRVKSVIFVSIEASMEEKNWLDHGSFGRKVIFSVSPEASPENREMPFPWATTIIYS